MNDPRAPGGTAERATVQTSNGKWVEPEVSYIDPARRFCEYCGRPIARRYWEWTELGMALVYCSPGHAVSHATYPKSTK